MSQVLLVVFCKNQLKQRKGRNFDILANAIFLNLGTDVELYSQYLYQQHIESSSVIIYRYTDIKREKLHIFAEAQRASIIVCCLMYLFFGIIFYVKL